MDWEWWQDKNTFRLFVYLLLNANFSDSEYKGEIIKRGELATTFSEMAGQTNLTIKEVRVALNHLKRTHEVAHRTNRQFSVISITKYDEYQARGKAEGKRRANEGQTGGVEKGKQNKEDILNKEYIKNISTRPRARNEKIHNFPEREYNFEELTKRIKKKGGDLNDNTAN